MVDVIKESNKMGNHKLAAKLHRSTRRIFAVLSHAMLEWILMFLLLFNSLLYCFIKKFANFFSLKPSCLWCTSSIDHVFDASKNATADSYGDLFCEAHSAQISELSYCVNHKKQVASRNMCTDCSPSGLKYKERPSHCSEDVSFCAWMREIGASTDDKLLRCSCCGKSCSNEFCSSHDDHLAQGSMEVTQKERIKVEDIAAEDHTHNGEDYKGPDDEPQLALPDVGSSYLREAPQDDSSRSLSKSLCDANEANNDNGDVTVEEDFIQVVFASRSSCGDTETWLCDGNRESLESIYSSSRNACANEAPTKTGPVLITETSNDIASGKLTDDNQRDVQAKQFIGDGLVELKDEIKETEHAEIVKARTGAANIIDGCKTDTSSKCEGFLSASECQTSSVITGDMNSAADEAMDHNHSVFVGQDQDEILSNSHKTHPTNTEEEKTLPVNIVIEGEIDDQRCAVDPYLAIEQLRSDLKSEQKARRDLVSELEAERNASAIAASQTMAMITRLQEEKAAIKTDALQYQRMMEEQAEYDQEALQLLNELIIKREKEKEELQVELEMYREKLLNYELEKEISKRSRSSSPCYAIKDSDAKDHILASDQNGEVGGEELVGETDNKDVSTGEVLTSFDNVLDRVKNWNMLDGSLEDFEEERTSILQQLKELEVKLYTMCDENEFKDVKPIEHFAEGESRVTEENAKLCSKEVKLISSGCLVQSNSMAVAAQKLLPLLELGGAGDARECTSQKDDTIGCDHGTEKREIIAGSREGLEDKMLAIVKEMDHVYGRLQAMEADREFLRHCVSSLNKGDKGINLLEEILEDLRELRAGELWTTDLPRVKTKNV